jgi:hypothetical protein
VAEIALGAIFPAMKVGMTVLAIAPDVCKHWIEVTLLAGNGRVQSSQGIAGLVVIEFGFATYGHPRRGCMTFFTRHLHRPVGTGVGRYRLLAGLGTGYGLQHQQYRD